MGFKPLTFHLAKVFPEKRPCLVLITSDDSKYDYLESSLDKFPLINFYSIKPWSRYCNLNIELLLIPLWLFFDRDGTNKSSFGNLTNVQFENLLTNWTR